MYLKAVETDLNKLCRLCLHQGFDEDYVPINKSNELVKKIEECISLQISFTSNLPSVICVACLRHVNQWSTFREVCRQSQNILIQTFNSENSEKTTFYDTVNLQLSDITCDNYESTDRASICNIENANKNETKVKINNESVQSTNKSYASHANVKFKKDKRKKIRHGKVKSRFKKSKEIKDVNLDMDDSFNENNIYELEKYLYELYQEDSGKELSNYKCNFIYNCEICSQSFNAIFEYLDHQESHNGQPVFQCQKCEQIFNTRQELVEHDSRHQVPCSKCGKLVLPSSLKTHMVLHTDKYKCTQCNWRFCNNTMLKQHVESVHIRLKTQVCETCGKSFTSTTSLQTHIKIHSDTRPYSCKLCPYSGRTASALYTHMARHENGLHVCDVCAKSFKSFRSLRDHTRRVHSQNKNHECGFCQKKFVDKYMLTVHTRTHTGARPYECNQCDRAFVRSDGLRDHLATHSQRAIYNCQECGKKFIYRRSLGRHVCTAVNNKI